MVGLPRWEVQVLDPEEMAMSYTCPTCSKGTEADHTACRIAQDEEAGRERQLDVQQEILEELKVMRRLLEKILGEMP